MSISERERHELYLGLEEMMGTTRADTMMAMLPPVGWADVVTKHDLTRELAIMENRLEAMENRLEAKFERELRELTRTMILALVMALVAMTSIYLTAIAFLR